MPHPVCRNPPHTHIYSMSTNTQAVFFVFVNKCAHTTYNPFTTYSASNTLMLMHTTKQCLELHRFAFIII